MVSPGRLEDRKPSSFQGQVEKGSIPGTEKELWEETTGGGGGSEAKGRGDRSTKGVRWARHWVYVSGAGLQCSRNVREPQHPQQDCRGKGWSHGVLVRRCSKPSPGPRVPALTCLNLTGTEQSRSSQIGNRTGCGIPFVWIQEQGTRAMGMADSTWLAQGAREGACGVAHRVRGGWGEVLCRSEHMEVNTRQASYKRGVSGTSCCLFYLNPKVNIQTQMKNNWV